MKGYELKVDEAACWGCKTCEVACKQEFNLAAGMRLITVTEEGPEAHTRPQDLIYRVNLCRHCDEPPCVAICPEEAIEKREDGIVVLNDELCSGCGLCLDTCPYDAIVFDNQTALARKCNLCHHRVDKGLIPACADNVCLAHCIHFIVAE